ncbi:MAG TPA: hypothetical protein VN493_23160 [Thermoanaerobaculia bacterium]|nr:hypothetical protein [Thermoanaerobaculia bacterium]
MTAFFIPTLLFILFALFSATGAYFLTAHFRGRTAGIVAALLTLFFFAALFLGLLVLMPAESLPGRYPGGIMPPAAGEMPGAAFAFSRTR